MDNIELEDFDVLRLFNEPNAPMLSMEPYNIRVDWKAFHQDSSALISPSNEPDFGRKNENNFCICFCNEISFNFNLINLFKLKSRSSEDAS